MNTCICSVCRSRVDLAFLIDGSGSIERLGRGNFARILNFVRSITRSLPIGRSKTRISVAVYSTRPYLIFGFRRYSSRNAILTAVRRIRYPSGGTKIGRALTFARYRMFTGRQTKGRKRVLIVLTDGISQDRITSPARRLKRSKNVEIFAIGVGRGFKIRQLQRIATDKRHVVTSGFRNLGRIVKSMKEKVCCKCSNSFFPLNT